jgi:hypothetical protein
MTGEPGNGEVPVSDRAPGQPETNTDTNTNSGHSIRWACHCSASPILLAVYDRSGRIEVKVGDRYYIAHGHMQAACPRCGTWHTLEVPTDTGPPFPDRRNRSA